jgi:hypothetical protein
VRKSLCATPGRQNRITGFSQELSEPKQETEIPINDQDHLISKSAIISFEPRSQALISEG